MSLPTISVIIPTYNYGHFLSAAINSVLAQTYAATEIIIVDDGSTDNTKDIVRSFGNDVVYLRQENSGLSAARNTGIVESKCDLIAFLDADDLWHPEKLKLQVDYLEAHVQFGMVYCGAREFDSMSGRTLGIHLDGKEGWLAEDLLNFEVPTVIAIGSTSLIKREVFDAIGKFDPQLNHSEDWDISFRIANKFRIGFVREILVEYRSHDKNMHKNIGRMEKAMVTCFEKAFISSDATRDGHRKTSYSNLYKVLAGSYFRSGEYLAFLRCSVISISLSPRKLLHFVKFPARWLERRIKPNQL